MKEFVSYSDFGAIGDGKTNDFFAILAAHKYANEHNLPVKAEAGKTYLITSIVGENGKPQTVTIKTDTDWCGANFLIDDSFITLDNYEAERGNIFTITSDTPSFSVTEDELIALLPERKLTKSTTQLDLKLGYPALLRVQDANSKVFIRYGQNANNGTSKTEIIKVDADGNIDPSTGFLFEYDNLTGITVFRCDTKPISVGNGNFTTKASHTNIGDIKLIYLSRNIHCSRSNTTLYNINHSIINERPEELDENGKRFRGFSYSGFYGIGNCDEVVVRDCLVQSHVYYNDMGTYEFSINSTNHTVLKNCIQTNFFEEGYGYPMVKTWGSTGSNFCKNLVYDGCRLSRYDAHSGVYNGKIINSDVCIVALIGGGDFLMENSTVYAKMQYPVTLRYDYGGTFNGNLTLRNVKVIDARRNAGLDEEKKTEYMIYTTAINHNFGYVTYFPNVIIDNVYLDNPAETVKLVNESWHLSPTTDPTKRDTNWRWANHPNIHIPSEDNKNPYTPPEFIKVINNDNGYKFVVNDCDMFQNVKLEGTELG